MMEQVVIAALAHCRPELLSEWRLRLRAKPVVSPLALPASLDHLMVRTLDDLTIRLGQETLLKSVRPSPPPTDNGVWPPPCRCGLNPFLAYYLSGEQALAFVLSTRVESLSADTLQRITTIWRLLAGEDIEGFCGVCRFTGNETEAGGCQARSKPAPVRLRRPAKATAAKRIPA
jgi:hypothetical protein